MALTQCATLDQTLADWNRRKASSSTDKQFPRSDKELPHNPPSARTPYLPIEIWRDIFVFFVKGPDEPADWLRPERRVRLLSNVSRTWREACNTTSLLWTTITFSMLAEGPFWSLPDHLDASLSRSGSRKVSINMIHTYSKYFDEVIARILPEAHRVESFFLRSTVLQPPISSLLQVRLWGTMGSLKALTIENIRFWSSLDITTFLTRCPALESLRIGGITWGMPEEREGNSIALPNLRFLLCDAYLFFAFVGVKLDLPSLREFTVLNLEYNLPWNFLLSRVTVTATSLERLTASGCISSTAILKLLDTFPSASHLILDWSDASQQVFRDLSQEHRQPYPGPNLESVTVIRGQLENANIAQLIAVRMSSSRAQKHQIQVHLKQCRGISNDLGNYLVSNGFGTFEAYTGVSTNWRENDYTRFGLCYYPPKRARGYF